MTWERQACHDVTSYIAVHDGTQTSFQRGVAVVNLDKVTFGAAAGAAANVVVGGIGARLAMRIVVLLIGGQPAFTPGGTAGILVLAALLGTLLGLLVAATHSRAGERWRQADLLVGGLLTLLVMALFFSMRDGEAELLPAWQGRLLFAPLALLSTVAAGNAYAGLQRRYAGSPARRASWASFVAYGAALGLAFVGMMSLAGGALRLPRAVWQIAALTSPSSVDFAAGYAPMQALGFVFALGYFLLTWLLFWWGNSGAMRAGAIGCLLLAAGLFHVTGSMEAVMGRGTAADVAEGLLAAVGAGILAVVYWRLFTGPPSAVRRRPLITSLLLLVGSLAMIAALVALLPQWGVRQQAVPVTMVSVTLYLLPWLLLPAGLLCSIQGRTRRLGGATQCAPGGALTSTG